MGNLVQQPVMQPPVQNADGDKPKDAKPKAKREKKQPKVQPLSEVMDFEPEAHKHAKKARKPKTASTPVLTMDELAKEDPRLFLKIKS